jgi:hypothetical protein
MPGWLHPGALDDPMAPAIDLTNRGCFDAIGVPYTFGVYQGGELIDVCLRILQTTGFLASYADQQLLEQLIATEGPEKGRRIFNDLYNWQFCTRRNQSASAGELPGFYWFGSGREHPRWTGKVFTIQANEYLPPGASFAEPPAEAVITSRTNITQGDDLRRWSLFPRSAPQSIDPPTPYDVWQSYDAEPGNTGGMPADVYRSGVFPFPGVILWGCSAGNYMQPIELRPIQQ